MNGSSFSSTVASCFSSLFTATSSLSVFSTGLLKRIRMEFGVEEKPVEKTDNEEVAVNNDEKQDATVEEKDEPFIYNDGVLTMDIIVNNKVDAMIGMDDITPYDFME